MVGFRFRAKVRVSMVLVTVIRVMVKVTVMVRVFMVMVLVRVRVNMGGIRNMTIQNLFFSSKALNFFIRFNRLVPVRKQDFEGNPDPVYRYVLVKRFVSAGLFKKVDKKRGRQKYYYDYTVKGLKLKRELLLLRRLLK